MTANFRSQISNLTLQQTSILCEKLETQLSIFINHDKF